MKIGICTDIHSLSNCHVDYFDYVELYFTSVMDLTPNRYNEIIRNNDDMVTPIEAAIIRIPPFVRIAASNRDYDFALYYFEKCLERARGLNISKITIGSGDARTADLSNKHEYNMLSSFFRKIDDLCPHYQYKVGIEAISKNMCSTLTTIKSVESFIVSSGLINTGITIDLYHMYENGDGIYEINEMNNLYHVHLCNPVNRKLPLAHDPYSYEQIFSALKRKKYIDRISIECINDSIECTMRSSVNFLKKILENKEH